ncbi:MAG: MGH1-like glycoside hydrolase domain-containing protein [Pyrinomonadaceae bacterium]
MTNKTNIEKQRLAAANSRKEDWKLWGTYVSERAWGTVREDYSADGDAWHYFPFEQSHLRAYRWNEDGIAGLSDRHQLICFAPAFWNGNDPILKERLFGLSGPEGNHGEDVKEYYYYLDGTPTHSYMRYLYKYPQKEYPYEDLRKTNAARTKQDSEYELIDTGIFDEDEYFDIFIEYAKAEFDDICIKITVENRAKEIAPLHILPTIWFRNRWTWAHAHPKPDMYLAESTVPELSFINLSEKKTGEYQLIASGCNEAVFTENETNFAVLFNGDNAGLTKDGFGEYLINKREDAISRKRGSKGAPVYSLEIEGESSEVIYLRFTEKNRAAKFSFKTQAEFETACEKVFEDRIKDADAFYDDLIPQNLDIDSQRIMRQSLAGMLWSKQFYHYVVTTWLEGDPDFPPPPPQRKKGRNIHWKNLFNDDVVSMPDKWEYPWYAAWDLAFHCVPLALLDSGFAKRQLLLLLREWYMHPSGQIPAYEWAFDDVNPPVHAWAALRVFQIERRETGKGDREFLEKIFQKLLLNFTWWVNRKDSEGDNVFEGGFLGLDNIGIFDRSKPLPSGGLLEQSDGTSWMAMFCLNMLAIAIELARKDNAYEDVATKFFEHFVYIADAMNNVGNEDTELWNERDGFYYDVLHLPGVYNMPLKVRSLVGLIPLFAVETIEESVFDSLPNFKRRTLWFLEHRPELVESIGCFIETDRGDRRLLSLVSRDRLRRVLHTMLSESEFLSSYGIRALSRYHRQHPYELNLDGEQYEVSYEPGESRTGMFGGNSNWRGPVWFPVNYLIIEALQKFDYFFGENFQIEFPTGSEKMHTLWDVSQELEQRLVSIFKRDEDGRRAVFGKSEKFQNDVHFRDYVLFYEYFNGDNGKGLGASHQTGWTGLIGKIIKQIGEFE